MRSKSLSGSRGRYSPAKRVRLLAKYHRSPWTQREFAGQHDLSLATLTRWLRLEREAGPATPCHPPFAEVPLAQVMGGTRWAAEMVRPDGWTVRVAQDAPPVLVEQLLRAC
jgi:transposase-like protein